MLVALRRIAIIAIIIVFVLISALLAYGNPEPIALDIGLMRIDEVSVTVIIALSFASGAIFGALIALMSLLRGSRERRTLRRQLNRVEDELGKLRSLPPTHAD